MATRTIRINFEKDGDNYAINGNGLHKCGQCGELATHSTTDSQQTAEGGWQETAQRFGCKTHTVTPNVILIDGTSMPFEQYQVQ